MGRHFMRHLRFALAFALLVGFLSAPASLQQPQKGGEDETGPYEVVPNWPQPWARPGYIWGSQPGVFAESPNRIFLAVRGERKLPATTGRGFDGIWAALGERATVPKAETRNWLPVVDGTGKVVEAWSPWDSLFEGAAHPGVRRRRKTSRHVAEHPVSESHRGHSRSATSVGIGRNERADVEVRHERQAAVLVGRLRHATGHLLGDASVLGRFRRESLRR